MFMERGKERYLLWTGLAFLLSLAVVLFIFRDLDIDELISVLSRAKLFWILVLVVLIPIEQVVRGWKWRQILYDIRPVPTFRLFAAVVAGYFANMAMPIGISPLVRAWLVARREGLKLPTVLVTTAIERLVDGIVFAGLIGVFVIFGDFPHVEGKLALGIVVVGVGSLLLFGGILRALFSSRDKLTGGSGYAGRLIGWLENRFQALSGFGDGLAMGIVWPREQKRGAAVLLASLTMKLISSAHFLWAGLAVGIVLAPFDYLLILIFASFAGILSRFVRMPGGFIIGAAFALSLLGVAEEPALAMVVFVHVASVLTTAGIGAVAFWQSGVKLSNVPIDSPS